ncbi:hypothetical protein ADK34_10000 [Streptomyces viridochromogenes]|uniref:Uncharacterized protein n=2 Tax=Streptomyces TaxID=1883 RepID=A0A0L8L0W9_STRVR|nr:hypothetical protein ADK34_10000 [Streptomyces viridochromogenes]
MLAVFACALLVGCTQEPAPQGRTERQTAEAYVQALNSRDVEALATLGPPGYEEVEADARKAVAADGGKGLEIDSVKVSHEFGADVASAHVVATDQAGKPFATYVPMFRHDGTWVVVLGHAPGAGKPGVSPAATESPD